MDELKNINAEIARVEKAIEKTESAKLKNDYGKYLKKLKSKRKALMYA